MTDYLTKYILFDLDLLRTCTVLDPKYKKLTFFNDKREMAKYYSSAGKTITDLNLDAIEKLNDSTSSINLSDPDDDETSFPNIKKEIERYVSFPKGSISKFYAQHEPLFSRLAQACKLFLITPATSVPTERLFSHAEFQVIKIKIKPMMKFLLLINK